MDPFRGYVFPDEGPFVSLRDTKARKFWAKSANPQLPFVTKLTLLSKMQSTKTGILAALCGQAARLLNPQFPGF